MARVLLEARALGLTPVPVDHLLILALRLYLASGVLVVAVRPHQTTTETIRTNAESPTPMMVR